MADFKGRKLKFPEHIIVIGGGRWAKVLLGTIIKIAPDHVQLTACSLRNSKALQEWSISQGFDNRIKVLDEYPIQPSSGLCVVIVANAVYDHEKAIVWALEQQMPVLVEKPISTCFSIAKNLINFANQKNAYFACAHVFLFASYLKAFVQLIQAQKNITTIDVFWADPAVENRHGEIKKYDPSLPVYADWLPHIMPILSVMLGNEKYIVDDIDYLEGGAHLRLHLIWGQITCKIELIRNADSRIRIFQVNTVNDKFTLNFCSEPGIIQANSITKPYDFEWTESPKPLVNMLTAFFQSASGIEIDERLDSSIGLLVAKVTDEISHIYSEHQIKWLNQELKNNSVVSEQKLDYALKELILSKYPFMYDQLEIIINYLWVCLKTEFIKKKYLGIASINKIIDFKINQINLTVKNNHKK